MAFLTNLKFHYSKMIIKCGLFSWDAFSFFFFFLSSPAFPYLSSSSYLLHANSIFSMGYWTCWIDTNGRWIFIIWLTIPDLICMKDNNKNLSDAVSSSGAAWLISSWLYETLSWTSARVAHWRAWNLILGMSLYEIVSLTRAGFTRFGQIGISCGVLSIF